MREVHNSTRTISRLAEGSHLPLRHQCASLRYAADTAVSLMKQHLRVPTPVASDAHSLLSVYLRLVYHSSKPLLTWLEHQHQLVCDLLASALDSIDAPAILAAGGTISERISILHVEGDALERSITIRGVVLTSAPVSAAAAVWHNTWLSSDSC